MRNKALSQNKLYFGETKIFKKFVVATSTKLTADD